MANKPTIYGFDDAGCKWETAHKADVPLIHVFEPTVDIVPENGNITISCSSDKFNNIKSGDLVVLALLKTIDIDITKGYERINLNISGLTLTGTSPYFGIYKYYTGSDWVIKNFNIPWATNMSIDTITGSIFQINATIIGVAE